MRPVKLWTVVAGVALTLAAGACSAAAKPSAHPGTTAVTTAGQAAGATASTRLSADAAAKLILGINQQIQQAANTPTGPKALTPAEVQAMVDSMNKQLGITVPKK